MCVFCWNSRDLRSERSPLTAACDVCRLWTKYLLLPLCLCSHCIQQILESVNHCHLNGIVHRDLKVSVWSVGCFWARAEGGPGSGSHAVASCQSAGCTHSTGRAGHPCVSREAVCGQAFPNVQHLPRDRSLKLACDVCRLWTKHHFCPVASVAVAEKLAAHCSPGAHSSQRR